MGMQRLSAAQTAAISFHRRADDIIIRLVDGQRTSGGLRMKAQPQGAGIFWHESGSRIILAQMRRAARSLQISSKKINVRIKRRMINAGAKSSTFIFCGEITSSTYSIPSRIVKRPVPERRWSRPHGMIAADADSVPARNKFCAGIRLCR